MSGRSPSRPISRSIRSAATRAASIRGCATTSASSRPRIATLAEDVREGAFVTPATEWFLDNFHLISSELVEIREHLPRRYYRQLPALATREEAGEARIYAMAVALLRHTDSRLDLPQLTLFLNSYQRVAPLTLGELWAWPSMLKLALIENLRRLADEILVEPRARAAPPTQDVAQLDAGAADDDGRRFPTTRTTPT